VTLLLRNLAFHAVFFSATVFFVVAAALAVPFGGDFYRKVPDAWSAFHRLCLRHLMGIDIRIEGTMPTGALICAIKHESLFEAIDLPAFLDRPVVFAKEELFRIPFWGKAAYAYGSVAVARSEGAKALRHMLTEAKRYAATGRPMAIFPEGTRIAHGARPPLQSGSAGLYKVLGLPVVPIAVDSGAIYRGFPKRRGTITYRIGEPIPPGLPRAEIEERVHAAINALNPPEAR
jgi:1-acyl-sn-glycerol-3-phosphate acyltransferase